MDKIEARYKKCGFCNEEIAYSSRRCPYCGSLVSELINSGNYHVAGDSSDTPAVDSKPIGNIQESATNSHPKSGQDGVNDDVDGEIHDQVSIDDYVKESQEKAAQESSLKNAHNGEFGASQSMNYNTGSMSQMENFQKYQETDESFKPLRNGTKVFMTVLSTVPWIGQLIGIIAAIIYMNSEYDTDRKSFGIALMTSSLVLFVIISCLGCFIAMGLSG